MGLMVAAHDRGRWSEAAGDRGWPPAVGKMARNGPVAHSRQSKVGDYFSLCRTPCEGSSGCPWWWRCWGVLEGVGGGSGWLKKGKKWQEKSPQNCAEQGQALQGLIARELLGRV